MMFGTHSEFLYWECLTCGCLQIATVPEHAFSRSEMRKFRAQADELNRQQLGDQAAFFMSAGSDNS
jgi:hypothetical protein